MPNTTPVDELERRLKAAREAADEAKRRLEAAQNAYWLKTFADVGVTLTVRELPAIDAAFTNMSQLNGARGQIDNYPCTPFAELERLSQVEVKTPGDGGAETPGDGAAIALDPDAFQIIRYHDITKGDKQWVRFGLQRTPPDGNDFTAFVRPDMFGLSDDASPFDLGRDAPEVARRLKMLWPKGQRVLALLGTARLNIVQGMELLEPIQKLVANLTDVAYMTGGYRGESGNSYGVTRAGFDVPKAKGLETLVIMCAAGIKDAHQTADAMSIYGQQWGDDTPGLSTASDAAVFFRNIPTGKVYGKWTDVEIANFVHRQKPLVILDPQASVTSETHFGAQVPVVKNAEEVAAYLTENLPTPKMVRARPPLHVKPATAAPVVQHEKYMAVRLYHPFDATHEYARWVLQGDDGRKPFENAGLKFSSSPAAIEGERDLVLDHYWKDIMLLQVLDKLPQTDGQVVDGDLAGAYAGYRKALEQLKPTQQVPDSWWTQVQNGAIDGIWFMFSAEHDRRVFAILQALPKDVYSQKAAAG